MRKSDYLILLLCSVYLFLLPFAPSSNSEQFLGVIFFAIGIIYLVELLLSKDARSQFKTNFNKVFLNFFTIAFVAFIVIMFAATIQSKDYSISIKEFTRYVYYLGIYFVIRFRINQKVMYEVIIRVFLASALLVLIIGVLEFYRYYSTGLTIEQIIISFRVKSTLAHHNTYAAYLILVIFPCVMVAFYSKGVRRIYYILLAMLAMANLAVTFSKSGLVAMAVGILILSIAYSWKFLFLSLAPGLYWLVSDNVSQRVSKILDSAYNDARFRLWKVAENMIKENMLFGVGSGNFRTMYTKYVTRFPELNLSETQALPPHNSYIRVFAEIGVFGAVTFLVLCFEMLKSVHYVREKCSGYIKFFYSGFLISTMCFLMMNCFDDLFYTPKVTINFLVFVFISFNIRANNI